MKSKKKPKKPKPRIKVAPPSKRHKSKKDYDRKKTKKFTYCEDEVIDEFIKNGLKNLAKAAKRAKAEDAEDVKQAKKLNKQHQQLLIKNGIPEPLKNATEKLSCLDVFEKHFNNNEICGYNIDRQRDFDIVESKKPWYECLLALFSFWPKEK